MDLKATYIPSKNILEGELLIKGKTLGRWHPKRFIIDQDQRVFALKSSDPKKKYKVYLLANYMIGNQEKKKDRFQFELVSQHGGKNVIMGSEDQSGAQRIMNMLQKLVGKQQVSQVLAPSRPSIVGLEKSGGALEQNIDYEIPNFFDISQVRESIHKVRQEDLQLDQYDLIQSGKLLMYRHNTNRLKFVVISIVDGNMADQIAKVIGSNSEIHKWNAFVSDGSQKVRELAEDKASVISEIRLMTNLFPFKREFFYLRFALQINNYHFIIEKSLDQKSNQNITRGFIKYSVWSVQFKNNQTHIILTTEQTMNGLTYQEEDSYLIQQYLEQIIKIGRDVMDVPQIIQPRVELIKVEQQPKEQQPNDTPTQQPQVQNIVPQLMKQGSNNNNEDDEFYDCEDDIDAMNDKLFIGSSASQKMNEQEFEEIATPCQRQSMVIQSEDNESNQDWVSKKMRAFQSGDYQNRAIAIKHQLAPTELDLVNRKLLRKIDGGHYVFRQDFIREDKNGGLKIINEEKIAAQKSVIKFLLTRIGTSLLMGKSLTGVSMPVTIFEARSNTERVCNSMGFAPILLEVAAQSQDKYFRVKQCMAFAFGFVFSYLSMEKPFNPILGETYSGFIDNCPVYCEQVSHHPPICVTQVYGRGYIIDSRLEMQANFHSNSVVGRNQGVTKIIFQNPHQVVHVLLAPGCLNGTTFGDKIMNYIDKQFCIDRENKIMAECTYNPDKKLCQYLNVEYVNQQDYVVGFVADVSDAAINKYNKETYKKYKGADYKNDIKALKHVIKGIWTKNIEVDGQKLIGITEDFPAKLQHAQYPLPSDANYRMDILEWHLKKFDASQSEKEKLEILQRNDRKQRELFKKKK